MIKKADLQRIKEIEDYYPREITATQLNELNHMNIQFLLKAFNVMREIAIYLEEDDRLEKTEAAQNRAARKLVKDLFEERMSK